MNALTIAALVTFALASAAGVLVLADIVRNGRKEELTLAQTQRRARRASAVTGVWLISVGLVIMAAQDWLSALSLLVMGPAYIIVGRFIWRHDERDHP